MEEKDLVKSMEDAGSVEVLRDRFGRTIKMLDTFTGKNRRQRRAEARKVRRGGAVEQEE